MTQSTDPRSPVAASGEVLEEHPGLLRALVRSVEGAIGLTIGVLLLLLVVFGPRLAPYDPSMIGVGDPLIGPTADHLLGTDQLGRDVWSRFLHGGTELLLVPLLAMVLATVLGGVLGVWAGYAGGLVDRVVVMVFDLALTLPPLLVVLVVIAGLGSSIPVLAVTVALVFAPRIGRVVRGASQVASGQEYVDAAVARGEHTGAILRREILPNIIAPVVADLALRMTYAIIFVATLNFLGLGSKPPSSNWGLMVAESRDLITTSPLIMIAPSVGIVLLSVSFNLLADGLTRHLTRVGTTTAGGVLNV